MKQFNDYVDAVRTSRRLDERSAIYDVRVVQRGTSLHIVGITTVPAAVEELIERLVAIKQREHIKDSVVRLPLHSNGAERHSLVRAALAPVYGDPALPAPQITQAVLGTRVELLARAGDWCRVRLEDGYLGWVHQGYLQFGVEEWAYAWERGTRGQPVVSLGAELVAEAGEVVARLPWGARVQRLSPTQYELPDGQRGSLASGEVVDVDRLIDRFPPRGDSVVRTARRWIGVPYHWGGVTPGGVDCSGLVQAVMWLHGIALPRDSDQQSRAGHAIAMTADFSTIKAGDLLFFAEISARVSHVAISLRGSHIVHSALTNGGVRINDLLGESEYERKLRSVFTHAQRVLPD